MNNINEEVLNAWLRLLLAVDSERLVKDMPFNEAVILNILYHNQDEKVTATELCEITGMMKSQMNRTLNSMEEKGLIRKVRSESDKRQVYLSIDENHYDSYLKMHEKILGIVDRIASNLSEDEIKEVIRVFNMVAEAAGKENK